jgi:hypothetical protein
LKSLIAVTILLFAFFIFSAPSLLAQGFESQSRNPVPFLRIGLFGGRTGTALGPSGYAEVNPLRWVGVCAFASRSNATSGTNGGTAHDWDFSTGMCVVGHASEIKGVLISPFVQMAYQNNHTRFIMPLADGSFYHEGRDDMRRQWTIGVGIDRAIVKNGPRWAMRVGRNYGNGPEVNNAHGLYLVCGVILPLDHPIELARSLRIVK